MNLTTRWIRVGVVVPTVALAATLTIALSLRGRLPEPIATHWGAGSNPNGTMPFAVSQLFNLGLAGIFIAIGAALCAGLRTDWLAARQVSSFVLGMVAFLCGINLVTLTANLNKSSWHEAELSWGLLILAVLLIPAGFAVGWRLFGRIPAEHARRKDVPTSPPLSVGLRRDETAIWIGHLANRGLLLLGLALPGVFLASALLTGQWWLIALGASTGLLSVGLAAIRVTVDTRGLTVTSLHLPVRWKHVPLDRIATASAIEVEPMRWGGWGYRVVPGGSAIVLRRGPGVRLDLTGGGVFVVTVDDPHGAAGLLNDLIARRHA